MDDRLTRKRGGSGGSQSNARTNASDDPDGNGDGPAERTSPGGGDVFNVLEDIESQFDRLRTIRSDQFNGFNDLMKRATKLEADELDLAGAQNQLSQDREAWTTEQQGQREVLHDGRQQVDVDRDALAVEHDALERQQRAFDQACETQRSSLDQQAADLTHRNADLAEVGCDLAARRSSLESDQQRLTDERIQTNDAQDALIAALHAARQLVQRRGCRLRESDTQLIDLRRQRRSLRLRRAGLESAGRAFRQRLAASEAVALSREQQLEEAGRRMRAFMERLRDQTDLIQQGNSAIRLMDSLQTQIESLERQVQDSVSCDPGALQAAQERIEILEQQLQEVRIDAARIATLEQEIETLRAAAEPGTHTDSDAEVTLQDRQRRLGEIARHLHRRRTRLKRLHQAMQSTQPPPDRAEPVQHTLRQSEVIEQRQRELDDVRRMLTNSERQMLRRWAAPRSLVLTGWIIVLLSLIAAASWVAADRARPAVRTASVVLTPEARPGQTLDAASLKDWAAMHEAQLNSGTFIREVAKRASARRLTSFDSLGKVERLLKTRLTIDRGQPSRLVLTAASESPEQAAVLLDILATSMVVASRRSLASRPGGYASRVLDEQTDDGVLRYARINRTSLQDDRLPTAAVFFAGGVIVTFLLLGLIYARLLRAKRVFDQAHSQVLAP